MAMSERRNVVKVTVSLPADLYETIERKRHEIGETRSEYVVHSIRQLLRDQQVREWEEQDRVAYARTDTPEVRAEEEAWARAGLEEWAAENPYSE
jgi:metal-responsive CopG/Arc/MetJ family transcriptional regulator